jgi:hypothetical protein
MSKIYLFMLTFIFVGAASSCGDITPPNRLKGNNDSTSVSTSVEPSQTIADQGVGGVGAQGPAIEIGSVFVSTQVYPILFQCNAWPVSNPSFWTYWIHWDALFAAKTAVNACWSRTFLPCTYNCFRIR